MKRKVLVERIAQNVKEKPNVVQSVLREFVKVLAEAIKNGETVTISGLGQFKVKITKPKIGRNPKTGETVPIPERKKVSFRPTEWLRRYINS